MEGSSFDVDTGLGSQWPTEGTTTVPPHTIPKLQLQDEIFPIVPLPAAPVIEGQMVNAGVNPGEAGNANLQQQEDQPVMAHDVRVYRDHLRNYQYPYNAPPDEDPPVDDDEEEPVGEPVDELVGEPVGEPVDELVGEPVGDSVEESPEQVPIEESCTKEMHESTQSKQFVSTFSPPASTSTDGEPQDMVSPAIEPLFRRAKAIIVSEEQATQISEG